jgi:hypothetical protein
VFSERVVGRERVRRGGLKQRNEFNAQEGRDDEGLGGVVLIEGLPGECRRGDARAFVLPGMVLLVFILEELHLEREIVDSEKERDQSRGPRGEGRDMEKNLRHAVV